MLRLRWRPWLTREQKAEVVEDATRLLVAVVQLWIADGNPPDVIVHWVLRQLRQSDPRVARILRRSNQINQILARRDVQTFSQVDSR